MIRRCFSLRCIIPATLILLTTSCASSRQSRSTFEVIDTTHVTVHDTLRMTHVRDSIVVKVTERTREEDITYFDPQTGNPIQRNVTRDIERDFNSLLLQMLDSIYQSRDSIHDNASHVKSEEQELQQNGQSSLSPIQIFARRIASVLCLFFVIGLVICSIRVYKQSHL